MIGKRLGHQQIQMTDGCTQRTQDTAKASAGRTADSPAADTNTPLGTSSPVGSPRSRRRRGIYLLQVSVSAQIMTLKPNEPSLTFVASLWPCICLANGTSPVHSWAASRQGWRPARSLKSRFGATPAWQLSFVSPSVGRWMRRFVGPGITTGRVFMKPNEHPWFTVTIGSRTGTPRVPRRSTDCEKSYEQHVPPAPTMVLEGATAR